MYAISEDNGSDKEVNKPKKTVPQNITQVMIMVVDTISSVRLRRLLRVLLDSGSTTKLIYKKCLPRHCKPCKLSSSRKVNTLTGTYTSTEKSLCTISGYLSSIKIEMLTNRRHLYFYQRLASAMSFWVPIDLTKAGIDVKYTTGAMEWFDNELP